MIPVIPSRPDDYAADAAAVAAELANVPLHYAQELADTGIRVVACRDNVVDHLSHLADEEEVRRWPGGSSWRNIPGVYSPADRTVVIATVEGPGGARRVPSRGQRHGSVSLAVHETFHGYDYARGHLKSKASAFRSAWAVDKSLLGSDYFTNDQSGPEESYAESAARAFGLDARFRTDWPTLAAFWTAPSRGLVADSLIAGAEIAGDEGAGETPTIGFARIGGDGTLRLHMRAEGPGGIVGHGLLVVEPGDERHGRIAEHLGIADPEIAAEAYSARRMIPVRPFGPWD